ncbi:DJ-1/PfpI family protein [Colletotrichum orchidophilum]|uniref:DJ-1/PfpI family protein n=1 Tax=Colletotrichum orchidophilum TaxID=1209926 RepID=A0A1G4B8P3_9PEZI|nr:DJ-1/PfpI family protein [Colletotrichum orchidophilum]OHE97686.1 DJ-1/PfpI family protein [Colletotrichum orchidophilum]
MRFSIMAVAAATVSLGAGNPLHSTRSTPVITINSTLPVTFGAIVFRAMDMLDLFGPLDALQLAAFNRRMNLHLIAATLDPVTTAPQSAGMNAHNSSWWPTIQPTNTFEDDLDLDVLIVPGGPGVRAPGLEPIVEYVKNYYPRVKYLITICTGASFAAKAGALDGKRVTTNKAAWELITSQAPDAKWVSPARYVVDGNIWTSSGVTSGLDLTLEFIKQVYGEELATKVARIMEFVPHPADWDPFADINGVEPTYK